MKEKTIVSHKVIFRRPKTTELRVKTAEEIEKEPLNEETIEIRQRFGQVNKFRFNCMFMCDSYVGFDREIPMEFEIVADDPKREIEEYDGES